MKYYNPKTGKTVLREELKRLLNVSVPASGPESIGGWRLLHDGPIPDVRPGQALATGPIELQEGVYVQTYTATGSAQPPMPSLEERLSAVEDAIAELAAQAAGENPW